MESLHTKAIIIQKVDDNPIFHIRFKFTHPNSGKIIEEGRDVPFSMWHSLSIGQEIHIMTNQQVLNTEIWQIDFVGNNT